jgi:hypothetical protein
MKILAAIGVFAGFAAVIAAGLVLTVAQGNPWLLFAGLGLFALLFVRVGCTQH